MRDASAPVAPDPRGGETASAEGDLGDAVVVQDESPVSPTSDAVTISNESTSPAVAAVTTDDRHANGESEVDRPGGSSTPADGEARRQALSFVEQASKSQSPVEQAKLLTQALRSGSLDKAIDEKAYQDLLEANKRGILSPRVSDLCMSVEVKSGDSLWAICRRVRSESQLRVEPGLIRLVNAMSSDAIRPGMKLKVPSVAVSILVEKRKFRLTVMLGDVMLRRYSVGLGKNNKTPEGDFTIASRLKNPTWNKPGSRPIPAGDPLNVLGTRWLGFGKKAGFDDADTFGIHGTTEDGSIGTEASEGCVRMHNAEVEELFEWIAEGVTVHIES
jgi:hypothetical protein